MHATAELIEQLEELYRDYIGAAKADPTLFWHKQAPVNRLTGAPLWPSAHPTQLEFHKSQAPSRWLFGGNQSGKTEAADREAAYWLRCNHPYRKVPQRPLKGRMYALTYGKITEIIIPKLRHALPEALIDTKKGTEGFNSERKIFYVKTAWGADHEVFMCTYDQDLSVAEGGEYDFIAWDEPPPQPLYQANRMRLVARGGCEWGALTPLAQEIPWDVSWIFHEIQCKADMVNIAVWQMSTDENRANLDGEALDREFGGMTELEQKTRRYGQFAFLSGLVYQDPRFEPRYHVIEEFRGERIRDFSHAKRLVLESLRDTGGQVWHGLDHGIGNPTAVSWYLVKGKGKDARAVKFQEYLQDGLTIQHNCKNILELDAGLPKGPWMADPSIWQRDDVTGTVKADVYCDCGVPITQANNDVEYGHEIVQQMLRIPRDEEGRSWRENQYVPTPRLMYFACCEESIAAIQGYIRKAAASRRSGETRAKVPPAEQKKHLPDTERYVMAMFPTGERSAPPPLPEIDVVTGVPRRILITREMPLSGRFRQLESRLSRGMAPSGGM